MNKYCAAKYTNIVHAVCSKWIKLGQGSDIYFKRNLFSICRTFNSSNKLTPFFLAIKKATDAQSASVI